MKRILTAVLLLDSTTYGKPQPIEPARFMQTVISTADGVIVTVLINHRDKEAYNLFFRLSVMETNRVWLGTADRDHRYFEYKDAPDIGFFELEKK